MNRKFKNMLVRTKTYINENPFDALCYGVAIVAGSAAVYIYVKTDKDDEPKLAELNIHDSVAQYMFDTGTKMKFVSDMGELVLTAVQPVAE